MNASEQIIEVLDYFCKKVGLAIDWASVFASENVIPYVELLCSKYIIYEMATSIISMIVEIIFMVLIAILWKKLSNNKEFGVEHGSWYGEDSCLRYLCYAGIITSFILICVFFIEELYEIVKYVTFPEMAIVEELMEIYEELN